MMVKTFLKNTHRDQHVSTGDTCGEIKFNASNNDLGQVQYANGERPNKSHCSI